ncbi:hypothetical protein RN001_005699 [Aquatica leii]|uniref:Uncharacterized protein n=1 Tax=Aquatica leii TaxID=1421715 RepID=A0AAN7Q868_9COLE|nr:hypothetical protein RN001_005699 [Aquatica leii]
MGHSQKTHKEFYRITEDTYQTAKVAKVLLLLNAVKGSEFKGKTLEEIQVSENRIVEDECKNKEKQTDIEETIDNEIVSDSNECSTEKLDHPSNKVFTPLRNMVNTVNSAKIGNRVRWSKDAKKTVFSYFKNHLKSKIPPKKAECLSLIHERQDLFTETDWVRIKTLVYNTNRSK